MKIRDINSAPVVSTSKHLVRAKSSRPKAVIMAMAIALVLGGWVATRLIAIAAPQPPAPAPAVAEAEKGFPIHVELTKPQKVTIVIEDSAGKRVRNLMAETLLPAGSNVVNWDGYDDGTTGKDGELIRKRVAPGTYHARGLTHDGIKTIYEFTVYGGGKTPWPTDDMTGAWLADHSPTFGATFIPEGSPYGDGKPQVMLLASVAESGAPMVWIGTDGTTYQRRQLWGWGGGFSAATDFGKDKDPRYYAYVLNGNAGTKDPVVVKGLTTAKDSIGITYFDVKKVGPDVLSYTPKNDLEKNLYRDPMLTLSVRDGLAAFTVSTDNAVVLGDIKTGTILGTIDIPKPKGVLVVNKNTLLVSTGTSVSLCTLQWNGTTPTLASRTDVITGLEEARTLQMDLDQKHLFVADWGKSNQIKVYDALTYKPAYVIGQPGGLQVGKYNDQQMQCPNGMAIDDKGQLWVAEADWMPKRISIWDAATGKLLDARYGPPHYGGGGTIDPTDKTRMFFGEFGCTMEFKLDWTTGKATLVAIPVRTEVQPYDFNFLELGYGPEVPWHANGRTYLSLSYQTAHRSNNNVGLWLYDDKTMTAKPACFVGSFSFWANPVRGGKAENYDEVKKFLKVNQFEPFFAPLTCWTDLNSDGKVTRNELTFRIFPEKSGAVNRGDPKKTPREIAGFHMFSPRTDLSLCGSWNMMISPPTFRADGTPAYDIKKARFMVPPSNDQCWQEDGYSGILADDGFWLQDFKGYKNGKLVWSYPVDNDQGVPPRYPGNVVEPTRLMGPYFKMQKGEAGILGVTNGERGNMYIMTSDGLLVDTIGGHRATAELFRFPEAKRGMDVTGYSFEDEHFHPTVTHTANDEVYMVAGKEHCSIFRLDGLQNIKRQEFDDISLTAADLASIPARKVYPARKAGQAQMQVVQLTAAPKVDGKIDEWAGADWVDIGTAGKGTIAINGDKLYAAWKTTNPKVLANTAADPEFAFKRGGAVDLMIGRRNRVTKDMANGLSPLDGDFRLLACQVNGKNLAVLYRQVALDNKLGRPVLYESPIGKVNFDDVAIINDQVELAQTDGNVELSIPLKLLKLAGNENETFFGDMGILRGQGAQTTLRTYWNNIDTAMVSDIPTEVRLVPGNWGLLTVVKEVKH